MLWVNEILRPVAPEAEAESVIAVVAGVEEAP